MHIKQFDEMNLSPELIRALKVMKFTTPTPVQEKAIEPMLTGVDLMVQAPTGTGKTGAFGIPLVESIESANRNVQALVLCPTRELALQIMDVLKKLCLHKPGVRIAALYGGEPIHRQIMALKRRPQIVVATPGRLMDHMRRRTVRLGHVNLAVLDEADRMLDMGFRDDMHTILQDVPEERQTVLFSATISPEIKQLAGKFQQDAQFIHIKQDTLTVDCVQQFYTEIRGKGKTPALINLLQEKSYALSLVFVATKAMADSLAAELVANGFRAGALHGDLRQRQRDIVMNKYRTGGIHVLVATDVAARGIDVNNIDAVINYDIPLESASYVHRIGRTGRASKTGVAHTFIYPKERFKLRSIMQETGANIAPTDLEQGARPLTPIRADKKPDQRRKSFKSGKTWQKNRGKSSRRSGQTVSVGA